MNTLVIIQDRYGANGELFSSARAQDRYQAFAQIAFRNGLRVVVTSADTYLGDMTFSSGFSLSEGELTFQDQQVKADLLYLKSPHLIEHFQNGERLACDVRLERLNDDKLAMYDFFADLMPQTYEITQENWKEVLKRISSDLCVIKPVDQSGGEGVSIQKCEDVDFPTLVEPGTRYILQEFLDSSGGIFGIVEGKHDLRVIITDDTPVLTYVRTPPGTSAVANVSMGGGVIQLDIDQVPEVVMSLIKKVQERLANMSPKLYTVDTFLIGDRPYLIEINTAPGLLEPGVYTPDYIERYNSVLSQYFLKLIVSTV